jgi:hypothetical protein
MSLKDKVTSSKSETNGKAESNGEVKVKKNVDAWGCRIGSQLHTINECIRTHGPITMSELQARLDLPDTRYNHVNRMIAKGHVIKTDDGYAPAEPVAKKSKKNRKARKAE